MTRLGEKIRRIRQSWRSACVRSRVQSLTYNRLTRCTHRRGAAEAAGQIRNAGLEAAKLRQAAAVIAQVGREISREVGQGMRIRF